MPQGFKKSGERRREILMASQELFNTKGFESTSVNDIMKKVGIAKGAFYYYFESKDQILDVLIDQYIEAKTTVIKNIVTEPNHNAIQKLRLLFQEEFKQGIQNYDPANHMHNIRNVDMHQRILVKMVEKYVPIVSSVIKQGVEEGLFAIEYPLEVAETLVVGANFITDLGIFHWTRDEYLRKFKAIEEIIEKTLGIERGSFGFLSAMMQEIQLKTLSQHQVFQ